MITIRTNTTATATPVKTYDKRIRARDAAVAAIGPHARDGFEFTLDKVDGRWIWKATEEVRPETPAQLKANGGKKSVLAAKVAASPLKEAVAAAVEQDMSAKQFRAAAEKVADELLVKELPKGLTEDGCDSNGHRKTKSHCVLWTFANGCTMWMSKKEADAQKTLESVIDNAEAIAPAEVVVAVKGQAKVVKDPDHKNMFLVRYADGTVSGSLNLARANQAAMFVNKGEPAETGEKDPEDHSVKVPRITKKPVSTGDMRPDGLKEGSPAAILVDALCREGGATNQELCQAVGWKECMPMARKAAAKAGVTITTVKNKGELTRYVGTRATAV